MRKLPLLAGLALALAGSAAVAQLVDPRTAAGAAGVIMGSPSAEDAPVAIDPSRDPARRPAARPDLGQAAVEAGIRARTGERETVTAAPLDEAPILPVAPAPKPDKEKGPHAPTPLAP